jgi:undecaprenyl-diphosphatase
VAAVGLYGLAALVAYARVYLGVHYPRDVIAGAILGLLWGALSFLIVSQL